MKIVSAPMEIIPQHYPLWVFETHKNTETGEPFTTYKPIIGWVWVQDDAGLPPQLHPVVTSEYEVGPFDDEHLAANTTEWGVIDSRERDANEMKESLS